MSVFSFLKPFLCFSILNIAHVVCAYDWGVNQSQTSSHQEVLWLRYGAETMSPSSQLKWWGLEKSPSATLFIQKIVQNWLSFMIVWSQYHKIFWMKGSRRWHFWPPWLWSQYPAQSQFSWPKIRPALPPSIPNRGKIIFADFNIHVMINFHPEKNKSSPSDFLLLIERICLTLSSHMALFCTVMYNP